MQTDDSALPWFYGCDFDDPADLMVYEIATGVPKSESRAIRTPGDGELWDRMAPEIEPAMARGKVVICSFPDDDWD